MSLARNLLEQARLLATMDAGRPKQASLRRAVSTAYYAAFHLLVHDAAQRLSPVAPASLSPQIARAFGHAEMKQICRAVQDGNASFALKQLWPGTFSADLKLVAKSFIELQNERHRADYDLSATYVRVRAEEIIDTAESLFHAWDQVRSTDEANVFCAALLLGTRWAK